MPDLSSAPSHGVELSAISPALALRLVDHETGVVVAQQVRLALSALQRLRGLLGGPPLAPGEALLLRPCNGVHTMFMRYAIDVLFIDAACRVVALRPRMRPWRSSGFVRHAAATVELPAGTLAARGVRVGQQVVFLPRSG